MKKESTHSQDYDRKHGTGHNVKDKAALTEEFVDEKRKESDVEEKRNAGAGKDTKPFVHNPKEGK